MQGLTISLWSVLLFFIVLFAFSVWLWYGSKVAIRIWRICTLILLYMGSVLLFSQDSVVEIVFFIFSLIDFVLMICLRISPLSSIAVQQETISSNDHEPSS
jgi:hypothetical protein